MKKIGLLSLRLVKLVTDPESGTYKYGTYGDYAPFAQVKDGGIIELGHGGYLNDYAAADSLMFEDPQEKEEWEYNV